MFKQGVCVVLLALLQVGICRDVSHIRFGLISKHAPNYPEASRDITGSILKNVSADQCLIQCANNTRCDLFSFISDTKSCYLSNLEANILSKGLFRDNNTATYMMSRENTLRDFFFLDVAPVWPNYFEHQAVETADQCSDICVRDFRLCVAFAFYPTNSTCRKYSKSIILNGIPSNKIVERRNSNRDGMYFEKLAGSFVYFAAVIGHKFLGATPVPFDPEVSCAEYCLTHASCVGFTQGFNRSCQINSKMQLQDSIAGRKTNLVADDASIYFEMWKTTGFESDVRFHMEGQITSSGFPIDYPPERRFVRLISQPGMSLSASLTRWNIPINESGLCVDQLIINGEQQCKISQEQLPIALKPEMLDNGQESINVKLISSNGTQGNTTSDEYYGFRVEYKMTWNCAGEDSPIAVNARSLDKIFNPGYPRVQKQSTDCAWKISATSPKKVYLSFAKLPSNDSLLSISKDGKEVETENLQDGLFGNTVEIKFFSSKAKAGDSFLVYYSETNDTGLSEYKDRKSILCKDLCSVQSEETFPTDVDKYHVVNLRFDVDTQDYERMTGLSIAFNSLGFGHRDYFGDCRGGWIDVFIGRPFRPLSNEPFLRFCGTRPPQQPIMIAARSITIIARLFNKRYYDGSSILWPTELKGFSLNILTGFKMGFRAVRILNDTILTVSKGSDNYDYNLDKRWIIANQDKTVARVSVERAELATIPKKPTVCDNDRLEISVMRLGRFDDEIDVDFYRFCGKHQSNISRVFFGSSQLPITVKFTSDDRHNAPGFLIKVNYTTTYSLQLSEGGFSRMLVQDSGYIVSARYPELVTTPFNEASATWIVASKNDTHFLFVLEISSDPEPPKTVQLTFPNGDSKLLVLTPTEAALSKPMLLENNTRIKWIVKRNEQNKFAAKVTFVDPLTLTTTSAPGRTDSPPVDHFSKREGMSSGAVAALVIVLMLVGGLCLAGIGYYIVKIRNKADDGVTVNYNRHDDTSHVNMSPSSQTNPGFQSDS